MPVEGTRPLFANRIHGDAAFRTSPGGQKDLLMTRAFLFNLCCCVAGTLLLGAPVRAEDAPVKRVAVKGQVAARLRGESVNFKFLENPGDLDGSRYFEILFSDPDSPEHEVKARVKTDEDGKFSIRSIPAGVYTADVRIPTVAEGQDLGVLYRGRVEIKPDAPNQELNLPVNFLYIRVQDAQGQPFAWTTLRLGISRIGGELDQRWGQVVFSRGGLEGQQPGMPQPRDGSILVRLQKGGFSFSWSTKDVGAVIFPVVEEDLKVQYRMSFSVPGTGYKVHRFAAARGKAPAEVECPLQPFSVVSGKLKLDGLQADLQRTSLTLSVLDPDDDSDDSHPLHYANAPVGPDGSFQFKEVPAGMVQLSAEVTGKTAQQPSMRGVAREWLLLKERENRTDLPVTLQARTFFEPAPGDVFVTVVEGAARKPVPRIKVELLAAGAKRGTSGMTAPDGRCMFTMRRPRDYVVRITELLGGKQVVTDTPVSLEEVRRGVQKTISLDQKAQVASGSASFEVRSANGG
jgi:hypothetical protein